MEENDEVVLRDAELSDAEGILAVYAPYVEETAITFEYAVPSLEEFRDRIRATKKTHPYIVAERGGKIVGYAYAGRFQSRKAYDWSVEMTVYVKKDERRRGIGRRLYGELERQLREMGILNACACIAAPPEGDADDPYLTDQSIRFHEKLGYRMVGRFLSSGSKFGRWFDMVWMEKSLGPHVVNPSPVRWKNG